MITETKIKILSSAQGFGENEAVKINGEHCRT